MTHAEQVLTRIDALIDRRHLLKHPFYQAWVAGELPLDALRDYSKQYYKQVEAFPLYLGGIYTHCGNDLEARRCVLRNLIEEDHGPDNHPELWLRFAEGIDVSREQVLQSEALPQTKAAVGTFHRLCIDQSAASGMAAIYAYEAMTPEVAATKIAGLKEHYGIDDPETLSFFEVHEQADREHRQWDREVLARLVRDERDADQALTAAEEGVAALWTLLDGVHQPAARA